jgi:hypothetical protein
MLETAADWAAAQDGSDAVLTVDGTADEMASIGCVGQTASTIETESRMTAAP